MSLISPHTHTHAHVPAWPFRNYLCTAIIKIGPEQMRKKRYLCTEWLGLDCCCQGSASHSQRFFSPHTHTHMQTLTHSPPLSSCGISDPVFTKLTQIPFLGGGGEFLKCNGICKLYENIYLHVCLSMCMLICTCVPVGRMRVGSPACICVFGCACLFCSQVLFWCWREISSGCTMCLSPHLQTGQGCFNWTLKAWKISVIAVDWSIYLCM